MMMTRYAAFVSLLSVTGVATAAPRLAGPTGASGTSPVSSATLAALDTLVASSACTTGAYVYGIANDGTPLCALSVLTGVSPGDGIGVFTVSPGALELAMSGVINQPVSTLADSTSYTMDTPPLELLEYAGGGYARLKFRNGPNDSNGYWMLQATPVPNGGNDNQGFLWVSYQPPGGGLANLCDFRSNGDFETTSTVTANGANVGFGSQTSSYINASSNGPTETGIRTQNSGAGLALAVNGTSNLIGQTDSTDYLDEMTMTAKWLGGSRVRLPIYRSTLAGSTNVAPEASARCFDEQDIIIGGSCIENGGTNNLEATNPVWVNSPGQYAQWHCRWSGGTGHSAVAICLKARN